MADTAVITVTLNTAIDRVLEVDGLSAGAHVGARRLGRYAAGKGVNVSRALAKLGVTSVAVGFVGREEKDWFETQLRRTGDGCVMPRLLAVAGPTRENITLLAPHDHPPTDLHVREAGYEVRREDVQRLSDMLDQTVRPGDVVVFSGSLPTGVRADDLARWVSVLGHRGARVVLDSDGTILRQVLFGAAADSARPWLVKPNGAELAACLDTTAARDLTHLAAQARQLSGRATWIAATAGAQGAVVVGDGGVWTGRLRGPFAASRHQVLNTVGCGDCFLAGLLAGLLRGESGSAAGGAAARADGALRQALAVAAANTLGPGAADFDIGTIAELRSSAVVRPAET